MCHITYGAHARALNGFHLTCGKNRIMAFRSFEQRLEFFTDIVRSRILRLYHVGKLLSHLHNEDMYH